MMPITIITNIAPTPIPVLNIAPTTAQLLNDDSIIKSSESLIKWVVFNGIIFK